MNYPDSLLLSNRFLIFLGNLLLSQLWLIQFSLAQPNFLDLEQQLTAYHASLSALRKEHPNHRTMPDTDLQFYLFGMGDRQKLIYQRGVLKDALTGSVVKKWSVSKEWIVPPAYTVALEITDGSRVSITEDEKGIWLIEGGQKTALSRSHLQLPNFKGKKYAPILRVLHHEVLINIIDGKPVPNYFVYQKPWYRDASLMGMVLKQTGNLRLIKDWILTIRDPFDRNNKGISEADNPGQVLFLLSLVTNKSHPVVQTVLDSVVQFRKTGKNGSYIEGKSDYALHPVYQTKWLKFGLKALGLPDPYHVPNVYDSYSSLFWWDYKDQHVHGERFDKSSSINYPYLVWAEDHFYGERNGIVTNGSYPLSWEAYASEADYAGLTQLSKKLVAEKLALPHTWHAAEMFLLLTKQ